VACEVQPRPDAVSRSSANGASRRASSLAAGFGGVPTGDFEGLYGVLEHRLHLLHRDTREPRDEAQSGSISLTFNPIYNQGGALSRIAGNWQDVETGQIINVNSAGVVFSQEAATNCVINGQVSTINTAFNACSVTYTFSNCRFPYNLQNNTTATGLAFVDSSVTPNRAYFAGQYRVGNTAYTTYAYGPKVGG
jgi:hypothetical protein